MTSVLILTAAGGTSPQVTVDWAPDGAELAGAGLDGSQSASLIDPTAPGSGIGIEQLIGDTFAVPIGADNYLPGETVQMCVAPGTEGQQLLGNTAVWPAVDDPSSTLSTLAFRNVEDVAVGVEWTYTGTHSADGVEPLNAAYLVHTDGEGVPDGELFYLGTTLGDNELKTVEQAPDTHAPGDFFALATGIEGTIYVLSEPAEWPFLSPPPPPPEPTYTDWSEIYGTLPTLEGPFVTGFRITVSTVDLLTWAWDRYPDAIEYQLVFRHIANPVFTLLATVAQTADDTITYSKPSWQDDARFLPGGTMVYRLRARLT